VDDVTLIHPFLAGVFLV